MGSGGAATGIVIWLKAGFLHQSRDKAAAVDAGRAIDGAADILPFGLATPDGLGVGRFSLGIGGRVKSFPSIFEDERLERTGVAGGIEARGISAEGVAGAFAGGWLNIRAI